MKQIWAPWRMDYILGPKDDGCIFCFDPKEDAIRYVLKRTGRAFVIMNKYPYTNGHLLVVPNVHHSHPGELSPEDYAALNELLLKSIMCLDKAVSPDGMNVGMNLGKVAGAGVADHIHYHIVPRWDGDHNYMAVLGEVRMINQHLEETYQHLLPFFKD
jgi:ATP adenylyltransferase